MRTKLRKLLRQGRQGRGNKGITITKSNHTIVAATYPSQEDEDPNQKAEVAISEDNGMNWEIRQFANFSVGQARAIEHKWNTLNLAPQPEDASKAKPYFRDDSEDRGIPYFATCYM